MTIATGQGAAVDVGGHVTTASGDRTPSSRVCSTNSTIAFVEAPSFQLASADVVGSLVRAEAPDLI
jgi:hypothetical protein